MVQPAQRRQPARTQPFLAVGRLIWLLVKQPRLWLSDFDDSLMHSRELAASMADILAGACGITPDEFLAETRDPRFRDHRTGYDLFAHCAHHGVSAPDVRRLVAASSIDWTQFLEPNAAAVLQAAQAAGYHVVILTTGSFGYQVLKVTLAGLVDFDVIVVDRPKTEVVASALTWLRRLFPLAWRRLQSLVVVDDKRSHLRPLAQWLDAAGISEGTPVGQKFRLIQVPAISGSVPDHSGPGVTEPRFGIQDNTLGGLLTELSQAA